MPDTKEAEKFWYLLVPRKRLSFQKSRVSNTELPIETMWDIVWLIGGLLVAIKF